MEKYIILFMSAFLSYYISNSSIQVGKTIKLPEPKYQSKISVEEALSKRRSARSYRDEPLTLKELSQLLWAAQGITDERRGYRTAPSAGALYPLEIFVVVGKVEELQAGLYHYDAKEHSITMKAAKQLRAKLSNAALGQNPVREAPVNLVFTAIYQRTTQKYGQRGKRYVHIEVGHACQNVYLQAETINLGTVIIGAFRDEEVKSLLNLKSEEPLAIMPVGKK